MIREYILTTCITTLPIAAVILAMSLTIVSAKSNDTYLSSEIQDYCYEIGDGYGISPELIMSIIETESSGKANVSNGACKGLMQISTRWHSGRMKRLGVTDIYDEYGNILVGADYLAELFEDYAEPSLVLDIYSGNSKAFYNYKNGIISNYAEKVLDRCEELEREHGK